MGAQSRTPIVDFLLERAGDRIRSVASYSATDSQVLFLREDDPEGYDAQRLESVIEECRKENARSGRIEHMHGDDGPLNCVVRTFDRGVEMHFVTGDEQGVVVGLDPDAATNLHGFVDDCLGHLDVED